MAVHRITLVLFLALGWIASVHACKPAPWLYPKSKLPAAYAEQLFAHADALFYARVIAVVTDPYKSPLGTRRSRAEITVIEQFKGPTDTTHIHTYVTRGTCQDPPFFEGEERLWVLRDSANADGTKTLYEVHASRRFLAFPDQILLPELRANRDRQ